MSYHALSNIYVSVSMQCVYTGVQYVCAYAEPINQYPMSLSFSTFVFDFSLIYFYNYEYLTILFSCMYMHHAGFPGTKVMGETGIRVMGVSVGPLREQQVIFTADPHLT